MKIKTMTLMGVLTAGSAILTIYFMVPYAIGYFNLGDVLVLSFGIVFTPVLSLLAGIGPMIGDYALGYGLFAPFTLVIKGTEALIVALLYWRLPHKLKFVAFLLGGLFMAFAYGFAYVFTSGGAWGAFFTYILPDSLQGIVSAILAYLLSPILIKLKQGTLK
jgi:uncharacterized membrane protein